MFDEKTCRFETQQTCLTICSLCAASSLRQHERRWQHVRWYDVSIWSTPKLAHQSLIFNPCRASDSTGKKGSMFDKMTCRFGTQHNLLINFWLFVAAYVPSSFSQRERKSQHVLLDDVSIWNTAKVAYRCHVHDNKCVRGIDLLKYASDRDSMSIEWRVDSYMPRKVSTTENMTFSSLFLQPVWYATYTRKCSCFTNWKSNSSFWSHLVELTHSHEAVRVCDRLAEGVVCGAVW